MAVISITIPDGELPRVVAAFVASYGYKTTLPDGSANPQTATQFTRQRVIDYVRGVVRAHEIEAAKQAVADPGQVPIT